MLRVDLAHVLGDSGISGVAVDEHGLAPERLESGKVRVAGRGHHALRDVIGEVPACHELEWMLALWMPEPQARPIRVEEALRVVEYLLEDRLEGLCAGQLGGESTESVRAGRIHDAHR